MALTLLVLAAGKGSRFGGLKQIEPVGPSGETLLDYAVYDAARAGFDRVVFVIRREFEEAFRSAVTGKYSGRVEVGFVFQAIEDVPEGCAVPAGREKPWGTGHAVWCARRALDGPFAVINADDFYGAGSYSRLAQFLRETTGSRFAMGGFRLENTLSENGSVSRGICRTKGGVLLSIAEVKKIGLEDVGPGRRFSGGEVVSMNCWGFTPALFAGLDAGLREFLSARASDPEAEWYIPEAISGLILGGAASVEVLPSEDRWFGITFRDDRARVAAAVDALVQGGAYPSRLFAGT
jgi:NDP-sugar pyrophosphorylase family protein